MGSGAATPSDAGAAPLNLRWTIGDVGLAGFEALRLALHGARRLFGAAAAYHVVVNSLPVEEARRRIGPVPAETRWRRAPAQAPEALRHFLDGGMSEGTSWKFAPLQIDPGVRELAFDNDVILWAIPEAMRLWLDRDDARLIAEDVAMGHGAFAALAGPAPRNSGIRGTPAGFDLGAAIAAVLRERPVPLESELDEQGLQVAAMRRGAEPLLVRVEEVSICSPFPPHMPGLGRCGAHFVGLNARGFDWDYDGRPALDVRLEHWRALRPELYRRVGLDPATEPSIAAAC
jgi:hypothetical protein